jgi:hypothetical protein
LDDSAEDWHLGRWLICNYGGHALYSLVETWQVECGFDALGLVVLFALEMTFLDGFNGALVDGI